MPESVLSWGQRQVMRRGVLSFCRQVRRIDAASGLWPPGIGLRWCGVRSAGQTRLMLRYPSHRDAWFAVPRSKGRRAWMTGAATRAGCTGSPEGGVWGPRPSER